MQSSQIWSIERVVVVLTPVFAGASGWAVGWIATHFPGHPQLNPSDVRDLSIFGVLSGTSAVLKWLHGRQKPAVVSGIAQDKHAALAIETATAGPPGPEGPQGPPGPQAAPAIVDEDALTDRVLGRIRRSLAASQ